MPLKKYRNDPKFTWTFEVGLRNRGITKAAQYAARHGYWRNKGEQIMTIYDLQKRSEIFTTSPQREEGNRRKCCKKKCLQCGSEEICAICSGGSHVSHGKGWMTPLKGKGKNLAKSRGPSGEGTIEKVLKNRSKGSLHGRGVLLSVGRQVYRVRPSSAFSRQHVWVKILRKVKNLPGGI